MWGLAYKQDTHSVKNSPSLALLSALTGMQVQAYDPQVKLDGIPGIEFRQAEHRSRCLQRGGRPGGDDALVGVPHGRPGRGGRPARQPLVIDPFGCLDAAHAAQLGLSYFKLGFSTPETRRDAA